MTDILYEHDRISQETRHNGLIRPDSFNSERRAITSPASSTEYSFAGDAVPTYPQQKPKFEYPVRPFYQKDDENRERHFEYNYTNIPREKTKSVTCPKIHEAYAVCKETPTVGVSYCNNNCRIDCIRCCDAANRTSFASGGWYSGNLNQIDPLYFYPKQTEKQREARFNSVIKKLKELKSKHRS